MKFESYGSYKECIFPLIDQIPTDWDEQRIKFQISDCVGGGTPESGNEVFWVESGEGTPWVSIADITRSSVITSTEKDVSARGVAAKGLTIVPKGTLLYSIFASLGKVAEAGADLTTNQAILALIPKETLDKGFFSYWLQSIERFLMYYATSNTQNNLNAEKVRNLPLLVPNAYEQEKIANFLDHETAKIDTLIEKQQQLIKLLKEKRQAVISHAVTKGLNPDAPMRDSGVEWLGEVPEHWMVVQLKFNTLEMRTGPFGSQLHAEDYVIGAIPLINPVHMVEGKIVPDSQVTVDKETQERLSRHKLSRGEIIFARRGELGRCAVVSESQEGWLCGTGSLKAKLNSRLIPEYAYLLIISDGVVSELSLESKGSTMDNLNTETLGRVRMPVPPASEQNEILKYVEGISGKYDSLIRKVKSAISLMQERRLALISSAVTGKIDVRSWQSPEKY